MSARTAGNRRRDNDESARGRRYEVMKAANPKDRASTTARPKRGRASPWDRYEQLKADLIARCLPAAEYARACRRIADTLGL